MKMSDLDGASLKMDAKQSKYMKILAMRK